MKISYLHNYTKMLYYWSNKINLPRWVYTYTLIKSDGELRICDVTATPFRKVPT